jgi:redox-sensitive bicupin YhaK (pirin superfamily)
MTRPDTDTAETRCEATGAAQVQVLTPREVPLGGPRAMTVRRTLPQRAVSLVGPWCFLDHYGPDEVGASGGMQVPRHPHTGLATVSWLFTGEVDHLDSAGHSARVRPGELNLMLAGRGITHSEFSTPETTVLHGVQLWFALPEGTRRSLPGFAHHVPSPVRVGDAELRVFIGSLGGSTSPVETRTGPMLGAEVLLPAGGSLVLDASSGLDPVFEHALLVDLGEVMLDAEGGPADPVVVPKDHLAHLPTGRARLSVTAGDEDARLVLLGGVPFGEQIVMWWNFVGRSHEEIAEFRARYQAELGFEPAPDGLEDLDGSGPGSDEGWFGPFPEGTPDPLPAPALPHTRMKPRG